MENYNVSYRINDCNDGRHAASSIRNGKKCQRHDGNGRKGLGYRT